MNRMEYIEKWQIVNFISSSIMLFTCLLGFIVRSTLLQDDHDFELGTWNLLVFIPKLDTIISFFVLL